MKTDKILSRSFLLIVIGQVISLFGNGILRFALPLYLLKITGSPSIFGAVTALSFLPLILVMPIGGIIADRLNKKNIMVILDLVTAISMIIFLICINNIDEVTLVVITLMILYSISALYQPAVLASIPTLLKEAVLVKGNSIIGSVSALSNILSPVIGGLLFGLYGIIPIVIVSIFCFLLSSLLELFIKLPSNETCEKIGIINLVKSDLSISTNFIFRKKRILIKIMIITCVLNLFVSSLLMISMPVLIIQRLGISEEIYGVASAILALGGLVGGILTGVLKPKMRKSYTLFYLVAFSLLPLGLSTIFIGNKLLSFSLILISAFSVMCLASMISILIITYVQSVTPGNIVGKVMSLLITVSICSQPLGQALYGFTFEFLQGYESLIILFAIIISITTAIYAKISFRKI